MFNSEQIQAINHLEGNCCVVACAGSGKTAVITNRINNLIHSHGISPANILAITFSKQSKDLIKKRLEAITGESLTKSVHIETFHSFAYKLIRKAGQNPEIMSAVQKKKVLSNIICGDMKLYPHYEEIDFPEINEFISCQKNHLLLPSQEEKITGSLTMPFDKQTMVEIYRRYEEARSMSEIIDFEDMVIDAYYLLLNNPVLLDYCRKTYQYIMVDEMQDINLAQHELLRIINETNNNLFVVGDALQNVYEWRNSDSSYLLNFKNIWPGAKVITMFRNYRSTKEIVSLANYLIEGLKETRFEEYRPAVSELSEPPGAVYWEFYEDEYEESEMVAAFVDYLVNTVKSRNYSDFAILTRTNSQLLHFENELYKKGIPFENISDTLFFENKEIDLLINYLKLAVNENNNEAYLKVYNKPNRWIGKVLFDKIQSTAKNENKSLYGAMLLYNEAQKSPNKNILKLFEIIEMLKDESVSLPKRINQLRFYTNLNKFASKETADTNNSLEKIENLERLEDLSAKFRTTIDFLEHINSLIYFEKTAGEDAVSLSTIHKAKGTEFPAVFITGLNEKLLPHKKTNNIEEEHRLLYVAITRAKEELYASSLGSYGNQNLKVSPFAMMIFGDDVSKVLASRLERIPYTTRAKDGLIEK